MFGRIRWRAHIAFVVMYMGGMINGQFFRGDTFNTILTLLVASAITWFVIDKELKQ